MQNTIKMYLDQGIITPEEAARLAIQGYPAEEHECTMGLDCPCDDCSRENYYYSKYGRK